MTRRTASWSTPLAQRGSKALLPAYRWCPCTAAADGETVALERLAPGGRLRAYEVPNGEEIYLLDGDLADGHGTYGAGTWMRNPSGLRYELMSTAGAVYWVKRGHLPPKP